MRVLQVMEATLRRNAALLEDVSEALGAGDCYGIVYSLHRADGAFMLLLEKLRRAGWQLFELDMRREIRPGTTLNARWRCRTSTARSNPTSCMRTAQKPVR